MKQLFPAGIMENTVQTHWTKRHSKSKIVYSAAEYILFSCYADERSILFFTGTRFFVPIGMTKNIKQIIYKT
jgi:hypothetical protein